VVTIIETESALAATLREQMAGLTPPIGDAAGWRMWVAKIPEVNRTLVEVFRIPIKAFEANDLNAAPNVYSVFRALRKSLAGESGGDHSEAFEAGAEKLEATEQRLQDRLGEEHKGRHWRPPARSVVGGQSPPDSRW
jgi:hypothetical protein